MQALLESDIAFLSPRCEDRSFRSSNERKPLRKAVYSVYSIKTLDTLFIEKNKGREETDLRFLVDMSGFLWFARETHAAPAPAAPPHCKLCADDNCRTAGNLFFNETLDTLIKINHKSSDYRPTYESLNWLLAILVLNEKLLPFKLPDTLQIDKLNDVGGYVKTNHITLASIRTWVETIDPALTRILLNQPSLTKHVEVLPPERPRLELNDRDTGVVNRVLFLDDRSILSTKAGAGSGSDSDSDIDSEEIERHMNKGTKKTKLQAPPARSPSP